MLCKSDVGGPLLGFNLKKFIDSLVCLNFSLSPCVFGLD